MAGSSLCFVLNPLIRFYYARQKLVIDIIQRQRTAGELALGFD